MKNVNAKRYPNISEAVAFRIAFAPLVYSYGSVCGSDILRELCPYCGKTEQYADFLTPKGPCSKMDRGILDIYHYGVSIAVRDLLVENFADISEDDFRACRSKTGEVVFYQITPRHVLPPMASQVGWQKLASCSKCGSVTYEREEITNELGYQYFYITEEALRQMHSLNVSYENFRRHYPIWVVSREVYGFLTERYPRMEFQPMFLAK